MAHDGAAELSDTTSRAMERYLERLRATSPRLRLERALRLSEQMRSATMGDVRRQHSDATEHGLAVAFLRRVYGDEIATRFEGRALRAPVAPRLEDSTLAVVRAFERMGVPHYVTGSLASSFHGDPRATNDSDIVAVLSPLHFKQLEDELRGRFCLDEEVFLDNVRECRCLNLMDEVDLAKVDVFCVEGGGYQAEALSRVVTMGVERNDAFNSVKAASACDVLLSKLGWYRFGHEVSDEQWRDALGVARAQAGRLDVEYLRRWGKEQGTLDLLQRLLADPSASVLTAHH